MAAPTYDDATVTYDSLDWTYDGNAVGETTPPAEEPVAVGAGPPQVRDIYAEERSRLFREDEEVLVMLL